MAKSYYEILNVDKKATKDEIKKAFYKKAHAHHPDKNGGDDKHFKEVNEAYQTLSDDGKRAQYDRFGSSGPGAGAGGFSSGQNPFEGFDFSNFGGGFSNNGGNVEFDLNDLFGEAFGFRRKKTKGDDMQTTFIITLEEAFTGINKKVKTKKGEVNVPIPEGVEDGETFVLKGYGGEEKDLPNGDLYIQIRVQNHKLYQRRDLNLFIELEFKLTDLMLGKEIEIMYLTGGKIKINIPELSHLQKEILIKGKGMKKSHRHGDLYIIPKIKMPKHLSKNAKELLEKLEKEI